MRFDPASELPATRQPFGNLCVAPPQRKGLTQIRKAISQTDADESYLNDISRLVVCGAFTVRNAPGAGFLEKVNENALAHELPNARLAIAQQPGLTIACDGIVTGEYVADLMVEQALLVELQAVNALKEGHHARCIRYLKASDPRPGLLLNVGTKRLEVERIADTV